MMKANPKHVLVSTNMYRTISRYIFAVSDIEMNRQHTAKLLHILSDDNHLQILCTIAYRQRCVGRCAFSGLSI